jgi:hypothetical protein
MKIIKSKNFWRFIAFCLVASVILIVINLSQLQKYRISQRNNKRKEDIGLIIASIKTYLNNNDNNLPKTSNPDEDSLLPEIIFAENTPTGGVSVSTLENMEGYSNVKLTDPSGSPYYIGTSADEVIIYSETLEIYKSSNQTYYESFKIPKGE